ncbi:hypothetical protein ACFVS2_25590 [Brevibacillus sp. NPDC058079]|uniref:hypothetical protein n=1 Tax=Brevibacillus sp. NPDC058079 TaxID=3346330 RepID=UPI0036EDF59F
MPALVTFEADNKIFLMTTSDNVVQAFETVQKGLNYFEDGYNRNHSRGYEASISACINNMSFSPSVHEWEHEDIAPLIEMGVVDMNSFRGYRLSNTSGSMNGALLTGEQAKEFHDRGVKPRLIG